ncbi:hypothetical protein [Amycolatopsis samaneae]|uniref:hypothetical protein n=1 Tax=Amycolatopsis samaneae TaxID=664691 RepID=UPI00367128AB
MARVSFTWRTKLAMTSSYLDGTTALLAVGEVRTDGGQFVAIQVGDGIPIRLDGTKPVNLAVLLRQIHSNKSAGTP